MLVLPLVRIENELFRTFDILLPKAFVPKQRFGQSYPGPSAKSLGFSQYSFYVGNQVTSPAGLSPVGSTFNVWCVRLKKALLEKPCVMLSFKTNSNSGFFNKFFRILFTK